jgi:two-component system OmpR family sensor kinase
MFRTLYAKLSLALFFLFFIVGATFFIVSLYSAYLYQQEVAQRLNRDLAMYIVDEHVHVQDGNINQAALKDLFHTVMIINPSLELYLLDNEGEVMAYSGEPGKVVRNKVSLQPVNAIMKGEESLPIFGDDPKSSDGYRTFSVAPIVSEGEPQGYIYAVLGSEQVDYISQLYQKSYIVRTGVSSVMLALLFAFSGGLIIFFFLTRRLRRLSQTMEIFGEKGFEQSIITINENNHRHDEIDAMSNTFKDMAGQIHSQMMQLKETDALRRELVANVSHDLRTPLASLKGYLEILLAKNGSLPDAERQEYLQIASNSSERLNKLVAELFELAKLDSGDLSLHKETFSLAELAHDVVQKFNLRAEEKSIQLDVSIDVDMPYVEADIGLIERVLDNLIDNALKNTPQDGCIVLGLNADGLTVKINIADNGRGIAEDELPHIFQRFYKKPENEKATGAGLGLAIAQRIVELHGSQLSVTSVLHQGTEFDFALPVPE